MENLKDKAKEAEQAAKEWFDKLDDRAKAGLKRTIENPVKSKYLGIGVFIGMVIQYVFIRLLGLY